jgi:hypothetical protein
MKNIAGLLIVSFFLLLWSAITLAFDVKLLTGVIGQLQALRYPSVGGSVLSSDVHSSKGDDTMTYRAEIHYAYTAEGRRYTSRQYRYGQMSSSDNHADKVQAAHPAGSEVMVYYNPNNPADAVLVRGLEGIDLFFALFMMPFNLIMLTGWVMMAGAIRNRAQRPVAGGIPVIEAGNLIRVRVQNQSPLATTALVAGVIAFISIFIVGFTFGFHPPLFVACIPWIIILVASVKTWRNVSQKNQQGEGDLLIDRVRQMISFTSLPDPDEVQTQDLRRLIWQLQNAAPQSRISISHSEITAIEIRQDSRTDSDGDVTYSYAPMIHWRSHGELRKSCLAVWSDKEQTEAFVVWLRQKLHVQC